MRSLPKCNGFTSDRIVDAVTSASHYALPPALW
jgi:hypothetical protein